MHCHVQPEVLLSASTDLINLALCHSSVRHYDIYTVVYNEMVCILSNIVAEMATTPVPCIAQKYSNTYSWRQMNISRGSDGLSRTEFNAQYSVYGGN